MTNEIDNAPRTYSGALLAVIAVALLCALGGLIWSYTINSKLTAQQADLADAKQQNVKLAAELARDQRPLNVATDELGKSLGSDPEADGHRAQESFARASRGSQRSATGNRPEADRAAGDRGFQRSDRREDGCGRREDRRGQDADRSGRAVAQLTSMKGDMSDHSSLIARNRDELEVLKHKGDRNYYEFTLAKGQRSRWAR
jgi:hypothetical protein